MLRRIDWCSKHDAERLDPIALTEDYYTPNIGSPHVAELLSAIDSLPQGTGQALEIGGGISNYRTYLQMLGYEYVNIDPAKGLVEYHQRRGIALISSSLENADLPASQLVLMAHSLEHVTDLEKAIQKIASSLEPGGHFVVVVPYGPDDMLNADHIWFFTPDSLRRVLETNAFKVDKVVTRQVVPKERFIYCTGCRDQLSTDRQPTCGSQ